MAAPFLVIPDGQSRWARLFIWNRANRDTPLSYIDMVGWCEEQFGPGGDDLGEPTKSWAALAGGTFAFRHENDAVFFKLRWWQ